MDIKFGTDGWRAIIDQDFNDENVSLATQAIANYFKESNKKSIVIGYDGRKKADYFAELAAQIMVANSIKVYLVNSVCPTPATGWSIIDKKADGAIMFTASHNPPKFLGLKFMTDEAMVAPSSVTDVFIENINRITAQDVCQTDYNEAVREGKIVLFDPKLAYFAKIKEIVDVEKIKKSHLKVLINPMFGAGVGYTEEILQGGDLQISTINNEYDSQFGGIDPEPIVEKNLVDAMVKVKADKLDLCLSTDGDADRLGLIDENGQMVSSLEAFLMLSYYFLEIKKLKGPIVRTLSNTIVVDHMAQKYGIDVHETKVGFKYVGEKMKEVGAIFGGEESGGSAINGFMLVRDSQIMGLSILDLLAETGKTLSETLAMVEEVAGGGYKFRREDVHFDYEAYEEIKNKKAPVLIANPPKEILGRKVVKTRTDDGLKMFFSDDSWLLMRFSGTEPVLRLYAESKNISDVNELIGYAKNYFEN